MENRKKLVTFSSIETRNLFDRILKDRSENESVSESSIMEDWLLKAILPANSDAAFWVKGLYYDNSDNALTRAFEGVFGYCAAGIGWDARETRVRPLVTLLRDISTQTEKDILLTGQEPQWEHLRTQWDSILERLRCTDDAETQKEISHGEELYRQICDERTAPLLRTNCIQYMLENWAQIENYTRTYRALCDFTLLIRPFSTPYYRCKFVDVITAVTNEWNS